jgi:histidinol phosphatase-like enzyme (inositol monophosphatase family)
MAVAPHRLDPDRLDALDGFLIELNHASADVILPLFRADHGMRNKAGSGDYDPVTEADQGAEQTIRRLIAGRFPDHGVIGEEYGEDRPDAEFVWVVDPIDGTKAFVAGLPVWTTLIGLRFQGEPVLGSIGQPFTGELFIGQAGGSRLISGGRESALRVRNCPNLNEAVIATTDPAIFAGDESAAWLRLRQAVRLARLGCDAYAYAMVALGAMDLVVETGLKAWDIEAAAPLIAGAGGVITDWSGARLGRRGGQVALAGDPACLDQALAILRPAAK